MSLTIRTRFTLIFAFLNLLNGCLISGAEECLKFGDSICRCKFKNGSIVDLSSIAQEGEPRFKDVKATTYNDTSEYSFNPCYEFKEGNSGECANGVTVCQKQGISNYHALGQAKNSHFEYDEASNQLFLMYRKGERTTTVTLICSRNAGEPKFEALGESKKRLHYYMTLTTVCACPDGCKGEESSGLSTGSVLVVLFFVFSAVYFFGGMLCLKFVRGASGTESIPNYDFWIDFPLLVRDGVVFLLNCCKAETTYERI